MVRTGNGFFKTNHKLRKILGAYKIAMFLTASHMQCDCLALMQCTKHPDKDMICHPGLKLHFTSQHHLLHFIAPEPVEGRGEVFGSLKALLWREAARK